jgi:hypothetical protein
MGKAPCPRHEPEAYRAAQIDRAARLTGWSLLLFFIVALAAALLLMSPLSHAASNRSRVNVDADIN